MEVSGRYIRFSVSSYSKKVTEIFLYHNSNLVMPKDQTVTLDRGTFDGNDNNIYDANDPNDPNRQITPYDSDFLKYYDTFDPLNPIWLDLGQIVTFDEIVIVHSISEDMPCYNIAISDDDITYTDILRTMSSKGDYDKDIETSRILRVTIPERGNHVIAGQVKTMANARVLLLRDNEAGFIKDKMTPFDQTITDDEGYYQFSFDIDNRAGLYYAYLLLPGLNQSQILGPFSPEKAG